MCTTHMYVCVCACVRVCWLHAGWMSATWIQSGRDLFVSRRSTSSRISSRSHRKRHDCDMAHLSISLSMYMCVWKSVCIYRVCTLRTLYNENRKLLCFLFDPFNSKENRQERMKKQKKERMKKTERMNTSHHHHPPMCEHLAMPRVTHKSLTHSLTRERERCDCTWQSH